MSIEAPAPEAPSRIVCGYCSHRWAGVVEPDCPVCAGAGYLVLGRASLARHGHEVTARAVEYVLEGAARAALNAKPRLGPAGDKRALTAAVAAMRRAKILGPAAGPGRPALADAFTRRNGSDEWIAGGHPRRGTAYTLTFGICDLRQVPAPLNGDMGGWAGWGRDLISTATRRAPT